LAFANGSWQDHYALPIQQRLLDLPSSQPYEFELVARRVHWKDLEELSEAHGEMAELVLVAPLEEQMKQKCSLSLSGDSFSYLGE
jgi:hypothetical protein